MAFIAKDAARQYRDWRFSDAPDLGYFAKLRTETAFFHAWVREKAMPDGLTLEQVNQTIDALVAMYEGEGEGKGFNVQKITPASFERLIKPRPPYLRGR